MLTLLFTLVLPTLVGLVHAQDKDDHDGGTWPPHHNMGEAPAREALSKMGATWSDGEGWQRRRDRIREHVARELGLLPPPRKTDLNAVARARVEHEGYAVSNVSFESFPGFFVTGNLYEPTGRDGPFPVVVAPHGHKRRAEGNPEGRMQHAYQTLCATLARMGAIVFTWDMVGWGENDQMEHRVPDAGPIQTWNTLRSIDFVTALACADATRVAATGSSGGGTQTFLAALLDDRIRASAPVVMVSAHWFGGCECESGLPIHQGEDFRTNNVEFAACAAPRPQLLVSVGGDWTRNTPRVEYPYLQRVYETYGMGGRIRNAHFQDEQHDYGPSKRAAVYEFLADELGLDIESVRASDGSVDESAVGILPREELLVFTTEHPRPDHALKGTRAVTEAFRSLPRRIQ